MDTNSSGRSVLLVGPLPNSHSIGGMQIALGHHVANPCLSRWRFGTVDTSKPRPATSNGKLDPLNFVYAARSYLVFLTMALRARPSVVQIETAHGVSFLKNSVFLHLAKLFGRRTIISIHSGFFSEAYTSAGRLGKWYIRWTLRRSNYVRVLSEGWRRHLAELIGLDADRVVAIPNAITSEELLVLAAGRCDALPESSGNRVRVLLAGWLGHNKGIYDLLEVVPRVAAQIPNVEFWLIGPEEVEGAYDKIAALQQSYGIQGCTRLVKQVRRDEMLGTYGRMDVFVLPSYREGLPHVVLEAMAAGLPVVASRVGAIPEVVRDRVDGLLIDPGDLRQLEDALVTLCRDRELRQKLGASGRQRVLDHYSQEAVGASFNELYTRVLH